MHMYWQSSDKLLIIGSKVALAALQWRNAACCFAACQLWCCFQQWGYDFAKCVAKVVISHLPNFQRLRINVFDSIALTSPPCTVLSACQRWCCFQQSRYDIGTLMKCVTKVLIVLLISHLPKSRRLRVNVFENIALTSQGCWLSNSSSRSFFKLGSCHLTVVKQRSASALLFPPAPLSSSPKRV